MVLQVEFLGDVQIELSPNIFMLLVQPVSGSYELHLGRLQARVEFWTEDIVVTVELVDVDGFFDQLDVLFQVLDVLLGTFSLTWTSGLETLA